MRSDGVIEAGVGALLGAVRHRWFSLYALVSKWRFRIAGTTCDGGCSLYR